MQQSRIGRNRSRAASEHRAGHRFLRESPSDQFEEQNTNLNNKTRGSKEEERQEESERAREREIIL